MMRVAELRALSGVTFVGRGFRVRRGRLVLTEVCTVVGVRAKLPVAAIPAGQAIPTELEDAPRTDVQQLNAQAIRPPVMGPRSFVRRERPILGGASIGHERITAGTAGLLVLRDGVRKILSNLHVLNNTNAGSPSDFVLQPGPHDGGTVAGDRVGQGQEGVRINFGAGEPPPDLPGCLGKLPGLFAAAALALLQPRATISLVDQPSPNEVDAALTDLLDDAWASPELHGDLGTISQGRDPELGAEWEKVGRTSEYTWGIVSALGDVQVSYGDAGVAAFRDQLMLRNPDGAQTSAGGDSGSCVKARGGRAAPVMHGLLFAGDDAEGLTIANPQSAVRRYLPFEFIP